MPFPKGGRHSKAAKAKMSRTRKQMWAEDYEHHRSLRARGPRPAQSKALRRRYAEDPAYRQKISSSLRGNSHTKGRSLSAEHKAKLSKAGRGKAKSAAHREKISVAVSRAVMDGRIRGGDQYGHRTWYQGILFRSKAEARYAAVLDSIEVEWQFEPCALPYQDEQGKRRHYVPDFWLPGLGVYLEIGAPKPTKLYKLEAVARANPDACIQLITLDEVAQASRRYLTKQRAA